MRCRVHNYRPGVDAGMAVQSAIGHLWPGTTQAGCWAALNVCTLDQVKR
jgi:hypothetical protein